MRQTNLTGEAKQAYEESQRKLLEAYLHQIRSAYEKTSAAGRESLFGNLEAIIRNPTRLIFKQNEEFDPKKAREIRARMGLTQFQIDDKLKIGRGQ